MMLPADSQSQLRWRLDLQQDGNIACAHSGFRAADDFDLAQDIYSHEARDTV